MYTVVACGITTPRLVITDHLICDVYSFATVQYKYANVYLLAGDVRTVWWWVSPLSSVSLFQLIFACIGKLPQQYARAINKIKEFRTAIGEISVEKSGISVTTKSRTLSVCNTNIPSHFSVSGTLDANINIIMFQRTNKT